MILLGWPSSRLSGHNSGSWRGKSAMVAKWRSDARLATLAAGYRTWPHDRHYDSDIQAVVTFYPPPGDRSDRLNLPTRLKPVWDGIAEALGVDDRLFTFPRYQMGEHVKGGRIVIYLEV